MKLCQNLKLGAERAREEGRSCYIVLCAADGILQPSLLNANQLNPGGVLPGCTSMRAWLTVSKNECLPQSHTFVFPSPGASHALQGMWFSTNGVSPKESNSCEVFGLPSTTGGSCYVNGGDSCGDLAHNRNPITCSTPKMISVACLPSSNNKLRLPWCVTYKNSQVACTNVGPNGWDACFCSESE
jgi:hypothetical protein